MSTDSRVLQTTMTHSFLRRPSGQSTIHGGPRVGGALAIVMTAVLGFAALPTSARADTAYEVAGGYVQNIHGKSTGVLLLEVPICSQTVEESSSRWCPEPWLVGIGRRSDSDEPSLRREELIGGVSVRWAHPNWWASFGAGLTDRITVALSSRYQFRSVVGVNVGPALVSLQHLSNGSTGGANHGETYVVAGWRF